MGRLDGHGALMNQDTYTVQTVYCLNHGELVATSRPYQSGDRAAEYFSFKSQQGKDKKNVVLPNKGKAHIVKVALLLQSSEQLEAKKVVEEKDFQCLHHREPVQL